MSRRVLVTGGAGFVGYHLVSRLLAVGGNEVTVIDDLSRGRLDPELTALLDGRGVDLVRADMTDQGFWTRLDGGFDDIYHLAAVIGVRHVLERPEEVMRVNAMSTLHLLDWFVRGGGNKLLFSSTSEAYAWTQHFYELPIPTPEDVPLALTDLANARCSYAASKIFGEVAVNQFCRSYGRPFAIVRYHNVYGPRMGADHVIPELYLRARSSPGPLVVYSPDHRRSFCYVADAVDATMAAMRTEAADGATINVGSDFEETTIRALAEQILDVAGIERELEFRSSANDPVKRRCPDLTRARELLGYEPRVGLREGLEKTIAWYAEHVPDGIGEEVSQR